MTYPGYTAAPEASNFPFRHEITTSVSSPVMGTKYTGYNALEPKYVELFTNVEEHRAVFMQPREDGLHALGIADAVGEYDTTLGTIMQDDILTVNQMEFKQQIVVDIKTNKIIGYKVGTVLPRSEAGFEQARELVRAVLAHYKPVKDEAADKVEKSVQTIDMMALPLNFLFSHEE